MRLILLAFLVNCWVEHVYAFSTGAGGCEGGMAAVGGLHLDDSNGRPVVPGTLVDGAISVRIAGQTIVPDSVAEFNAGEDLLVEVEAGDIAYLGVLVRLQAPDGVDTTNALVPGMNTQIASVCTAPVVGITHTDNTEKTLATGTLRFDEEVLGATLDVTVVFINISAGSAFVYSGFTINVRAADVPTIAPTITPTSIATAAPTPAGATQAPTSTTGSPTSSPGLTEAPFPTGVTEAPFPTPVPTIQPSTQSPVTGPTTQPPISGPTQPPAITPTPPPGQATPRPTTPSAPETPVPTKGGGLIPTPIPPKPPKKPKHPVYRPGKGGKGKGGKGKKSKKSKKSKKGKGKGKHHKSKYSKYYYEFYDDHYNNYYGKGGGGYPDKYYDDYYDYDDYYYYYDDDYYYYYSSSKSSSKYDDEYYYYYDDDDYYYKKNNNNQYQKNDNDKNTQLHWTLRGEYKYNPTTTTTRQRQPIRPPRE